MEKWDRILREQNVVVGLQSKRKFDALRELCSVLEHDEAIVDNEHFLTSLIQREKQSSTGIGKGVAVPHAHEDSIRRQVLAVGISKKGIEFDAIDRNPVHVIAVLATPKKHQKQHMELLAALSRFLQDDDTRNNLVEALSGAEVVGVFTANSNGSTPT